jgi:hypothetical protein
MWHAVSIATYRFDLDAHDLSMLQLLEHSIQHTQLGPAVHAGVDRVPIAKAVGQATPLEAVAPL